MTITYLKKAIKGINSYYSEIILNEILDKGCACMQLNDFKKIKAKRILYAIYQNELLKQK